MNQRRLNSAPAPFSVELRVGQEFGPNWPASSRREPVALVVSPSQSIEPRQTRANPTGLVTWDLAKVPEKRESKLSSGLPRL
jgi:hypothetical protein